MYVIMGGTGHVGSAAADALLDAGESVAIVTRSTTDAEHWRAKGAGLIEADVYDVDSLRAAFRQGERAFLLNPPADPDCDTDAVERGSAANILAALEGSGLEKVVAQSTYGAQRGERIGDLSVLWEFEEGLRSQSIPAAINRGAYYMSNWDGMLDPVRSSGMLPTMYPADLVIPMVAPSDLGRAAAERLRSPIDDVGVAYVEGPERYSSRDVAAAFSRAVGRDVDLDVTPPGEWEKTFLELGFSPRAAESFARMTEVSVNGDFEKPDDPRRGPTTLQHYIDALVDRRRQD